MLLFGLAGGASSSTGLAVASGRGDVNCDGTTNTVDAALILQLDAGLIPSLPCDVGDVDHNGLTNAVDSTFLLQRVAELIPALPALLRLNIETPQPVAVGAEVVVKVSIEDVEHLAAFQVQVSHDEGLLTFERIEDAGAILVDSSRSRQLLCSNDLNFLDLGAAVGCATNDPPVCLGGPPGPSGEGTLARFVFRASEVGVATLQLSRVQLISDDIRPCDLVSADVRLIPEQIRGAEITIVPAPTPTP